MAMVSGLTTSSTFSYETVQLMAATRGAEATLNVIWPAVHC
jgi:fluoride ion exporter CrcB/FEX